MMNMLSRLLCALIVFLIGCTPKETEVLLIITPSGEECDDYNVIWDIDSVISGDKDLNKKSIYLLNSKREYLDEEENTRFLLKGVFIQKQIREDFTNCGEVFRFIDESMGIWPPSAIPAGSYGANPMELHKNDYDVLELCK